MISLKCLAASYKAPTVDADGYDLSPAELTHKVERAIRRFLGEKVRFVAAFGEDVPNLFRGEVRAAHHAIRMAERDLSDLAALRRTEAA